MRKDIIVCLGTIGSPTFERCYRNILSIKESDRRIKDIVVIRNKSPQCAWLNEMVKNCTKATWCLQLDEDMYIEPYAIDQLLNTRPPVILLFLLYVYLTLQQSIQPRIPLISWMSISYTA